MCCIHITANCHWVSTAIQITVSRLTIASCKAKKDKAHASSNKNVVTTVSHLHDRTILQKKKLQHIPIVLKLPGEI